MKIRPIFITDGGEDWYDACASGAKMRYPRIEGYGSKIAGAARPGFVTQKQVYESYRPAGKIFLSNDHSATYALASRQNARLCAIVFDAHLDIYPTYGGSPLSKASVLRALDERGLLEKIIFVGTRASEELILREHGRKVCGYNREFAKGWREAGTFDGINAKLEVIPADETKSFEDGLEKAIKKSGNSRVFIDVDLDCFEGIDGVQYCEKFAGDIGKFVKEREDWAKKNGREIDEERKNEVLGYAEFSKNQMNEKGVPLKIDAEKTAKMLSTVAGRTEFLHFSEYEGKGAKAKALVEAIAGAAAKAGI